MRWNSSWARASWLRSSDVSPIGRPEKVAGDGIERRLGDLLHASYEHDETLEGAIDEDGTRPPPWRGGGQQVEDRSGVLFGRSTEFYGAHEDGGRGELLPQLVHVGLVLSAGK